MKANNGNGKKSKNGRNGRSRISKALVTRLCNTLSKTYYVETACHIVGISVKTYYNWIEKAEAGQSPYVDYLQALKKAEAEAERNLLQIIERAASTTWTAAAWLLERRHPDRWGRKDRLEAQHSGGIRVEVEWTQHDGNSNHSQKAGKDQVRAE